MKFLAEILNTISLRCIKQTKNNIFSGLEHSAATPLPCLALLGHSTADKREIKDFPKLPSATSFIPKTLSAIAWLLYCEVL